MFCPHCGTALNAADRFCRSCGAATEASSRGVESPAALSPDAAPLPESPLVLKRPGLVTLLAVLQFIGGGVALLIALAMTVAAARESQPLALAIVGGVCALLALLHLACGYGLLKLRRWGRALQIGLAFLGLLGFPLGTVISILILVYLFRPGIVLLFSERGPEEFTPEEVRALRAQASGESAAAVAVIAIAGLFVFIALAGIVAAIAIPNFLSAVERGKQRRTMADMRAAAAAVEAYAVDNGAYPDARTIDELASLLEPAYIRTMPRTDGWGHPLKYESWLEGEDDEAPTLYALGSAGKDGAWERADLIDTPEGRTRGPDADIVLVNGAFVQWPQGPHPAERPTDAPPPAERGPAEPDYTSVSPSSSLYRS